MLRATIGMVNYTGTACTFNFEKSVCILPEGVDRDHFKVRQLLALFPGSKVEEVGEGVAVEPMIATADDVAKAPPSAIDPSAETSDVLEEPVEEAREVETVSTDDVGSVADVLGAEKADEASIAEPVEEESEEEDEEKKPLEAGDIVLANYKGEFRKGKVVKVLESGVVRVDIDGDDANYRVLDDDKVSKFDPEAGE